MRLNGSSPVLLRGNGSPLFRGSGSPVSRSRGVAHKPQGECVTWVVSVDGKDGITSLRRSGSPACRGHGITRVQRVWVTSFQYSGAARRLLDTKEPFAEATRRPEQIC